MADFTPHQPENYQAVLRPSGHHSQQRLAELVSELYWPRARNGKRFWQAVSTAMQKLGVPQSRIDHLVEQNNPAW